MATTTRILDANVNGIVYTANANDALEALDTCHSGATAPTDEVANGKLWLDTSTTPGILKIYNNATWEVVGKHWTPSIDDNASATAMTLAASGNVGIGTNSPDALLAVKGQTVIGDLVADSANLTNLTSGTPPQLIAGWSVPAITWTPSSSTEAVFTRDGAMQIDILAGANNLSNINFSDPDDEDVGQISYDHSTDAMRFRTSNTERMRIDSSGNVGIGINSPASPLHIYNSSPFIRLTDADLDTRHSIIGGQNGNLTIAIDPNQTAAASFFSVDIDNTERMRIDSSGTVTATAFVGDGSGLTGVGGSTTAGDVGTYVFATTVNSTVAQPQFVFGSTYAGSGLYPAGLSAYTSLLNLGAMIYNDSNPFAVKDDGVSALSGTWRCMGQTAESAYYDEMPVTIFVRIS